MPARYTTTERQRKSECKAGAELSTTRGYPRGILTTQRQRIYGVYEMRATVRRRINSARDTNPRSTGYSRHKKTSLDHISVFQKKLVVPVLVGTQRFWVRTHLDSRPAIVLSPSASRAASLSHSARTSTPRRRKLLAARVERSRGHQRGKLRVV